MTASRAADDPSAVAAARDSARRLVIGVVVLLVVDLVGGLLAIDNDVNTAGEAWSSKDGLAGWLVAFQALLVTITLVVGALAVHRTVLLLRSREMSTAG